MKIKVIGFDADDTLWVNEPFFRETEHEFCKLFENRATEPEVMKILFGIEMANLNKYGYGSKAFMLSMIETTLQICDGQTTPAQIKQIMQLGGELLTRPREIISGVRETLEQLYGKFKLILVTKGDLLEQEQKLEKSGLIKYFHHIEILSEKNEENYRQLLKHLDVKPAEFLMVGNSLKSDIQPVLTIGGHGAYIPFHITWQHEHMDKADVLKDNFVELENISQLTELIL